MGTHAEQAARRRATESLSVEARSQRPMRVCLGGTFDPFHRGHEALVGRALELAGSDGHVFIGLAGDAFASSKRERSVRPYAEREGDLVSWLDGRGDRDRVQIRPLEEPHGPSATGDYDAIVVSLETAHAAEASNARRRAGGLAPLSIHVVPYILGDDLLPINATRVREGRIDRDGKRLVPLQVAVGSMNPVKVDAVKAAFTAFMSGLQLDVYGVDVVSGVDEQPRGDLTVEGARRRAQEAMRAEPPSTEDRPLRPDYSVGLEAGLYPGADTDLVYDVQHCVIVDASGFASHGHGPGFAYPPKVGAALEDPATTVEEVVGALAGEPKIGRTQGAVGWLSGGRLDRTRLSQAAVEAALVPRMRRHLYETDDDRPS